LRVPAEVLPLPAVMLGVFAFTLFFSASLLFLVEPMVGKMMLPLLGGTPAVWNTCMVFFQAILLAGYAYAHYTTTWLGPRKQAVAHLAILVLPLLFFLVNGPLVVNPSLIAGREGNPIPALLLVLTLSVGVPMFVVCTSAPLLQRWFSSTDHPDAADPYFLYGASNLGSMLALVGYPLFVEPLFTLAGQRFDWAIGYGMLAILTALCAWLMWKSRPAPGMALATAGADPVVAVSTPSATTKQGADPVAPVSAPPPGPPGAIKTASKSVQAAPKHQTPDTRHQTPVEEKRTTQPVTWVRRLKWTVLAAVPSSLMLGATTFITTDIAAIPLLWVGPLALYLLTFIIVFSVDSPGVLGTIAFCEALAVLGIFGWIGLPAFIQNPTALWLGRAVCILAAIASLGIFRIRDPRTIQNIMTVVGLDALILGLLLFAVKDHYYSGGSPDYFTNESIVWLGWLIGLGLIGFSFQILRLDDPALLHHVMIMVMPLLVLLLVFMMFSEEKLGIKGSIALHLATLFVVSMVCHGELARDRPAPRHLTEFFLLMSIGGVIGGLFNALFAPLAFNALIEYPLAMVVACLLLPPLGLTVNSVWARRADLALATVFLLVGGLLLYMVYRDPNSHPDLDLLKTGPWRWGLGGLGLAGLLWAVIAWRDHASPSTEGASRQDDAIDRLLDLVLPLTLMVLFVGLYWGLSANGVSGRVKGFADMIGMSTEDGGARFRNILKFGLPAVLCYTFVERSLRFSLGLGGLLFAAGFCTLINDSAIYQKRSFFGVLRVEEGVNIKDGRYYPFHRLVHGTTLHGKQFTSEGLRDVPLTYYHRSGPVGLVTRAYNDPKRPMAVIGLGTGSMACYALAGQTVDFFDIDPVVVGISYDTNEYFTFCEDAVRRGADVSLILGDARLTFEPKGEKERLKPLHKRKDQPVPAREFGKPLTPDQKYGLIVVDAFSSDAIPMHLITREALEIYRDRMLPDGILCMHISNRYLQLQPALANIVEDLGMAGYHMSDGEKSAVGKTSSHWVVIARKKEHLAKLLAPPRWQRIDDQLEMLGAALWPAPVASGLGISTGLCYAFEGVLDHVNKEKEASGRTTGTWKPLETPTQLQTDLEKAEENLKEAQEALTAAKESGDKKRQEQANIDLTEAEEKKAKLLKKIASNRRVGVWTDDYSNILSVVDW
jgi:hypothetical protein